MVAKTFSATHFGIEARIIEIEAVRHNASPVIQITGLPDDVVRESRERIRACLVNFGFDIPSSRVLVHLSPASAKKQGSQLDLGIAMSILVAEGALPEKLVTSAGFLGELSLDGTLHPVSGCIPLLQALEETPHVESIFIPMKNGEQASLLGSKKAICVSNLSDVLSILRGEPVEKTASPSPAAATEESFSFTIDDIVGHSLAKRALQIALAGRHHLLLVGPPGVGKTLLASVAPTLLPPLSPNQWIEVVKNYSYCPALLPRPMRPPFRSPHHSISRTGLLGGGSAEVLAGEVSLSHNGVLFLDELPEFRRDVIEGLREPLQMGIIHLHRVGQALSLPASFTLIAAMNPCPCGHGNTRVGRCHCQPPKLQQYRQRISGAILDRTDLMMTLSPPLRNKTLLSREHETTKEAIARAMAKQRQRFGEKRGAEVPVDIDKGVWRLGPGEKRWFETLLAEGSHSLRTLHKFVRVARTIADLAEKEEIEISHLEEAKALRCDSSALRAR